MAGNNSEGMPTFSENWMEGIPDRKAYIRPILKARDEFCELTGKEVRNMAMGLDANIKAWKLDQGASVGEVFSDAVSLTRGEPPPYRKSDLDIIQGNKDHPLFEKTLYRQRIALLIFKAAEKHDSDTVSLAENVLDILRAKDNQLKQFEENLTTGIRYADQVINKRMANLNNIRHLTDRNAKDLARETFSKMTEDKSIKAIHDITAEKFASLIQDILTANGDPKIYAWRTIWGWVKKLDPPGRGPGRK